MKRLFKKANQEFNQMMIDYFKNNQNLDCLYYYKYINSSKATMVVKITQIHFTFNFTLDAFPILENQKKRFQLYLDYLKNSDSIKEVIEPVLHEKIQERSESKIVDLVRVDEATFNRIYRGFSEMGMSLEEQNVRCAPYDMYIEDKKNSDFDLIGQVFFETNQGQSTYVEKQKDVKIKVEEYIAWYVLEKRDSIINRLNENITKNPIENPILIISHDMWVYSNKTNLHIGQYYNFWDFQEKFKNIINKYVFTIFKKEMWNQFNIIKKQQIRNFIKEQMGEDIEKW